MTCLDKNNTSFYYSVKTVENDSVFMSSVFLQTEIIQCGSNKLTIPTRIFSKFATKSHKRHIPLTFCLAIAYCIKLLLYKLLYLNYYFSRIQTQSCLISLPMVYIKSNDGNVIVVTSKTWRHQVTRINEKILCRP